MNLNIYINDTLAKQLDIIASTTLKKRNSLIQEAISLLVRNYKREKWPDSVLNFQGLNELAAWEGFEQHRKELKQPPSHFFEDI